MDAAPDLSPAPPFTADLRRELRRLLRWPGEDLLTIVCNALLVCGGWLLLPPAAKDWLFPLQGPLAFAVVLEAWMLADTTSTNMLANDPEAALAALPDPARLRRLLKVKSVALGCLIGPVCAAACIAIAAVDGHLGAGLVVGVVLLVLPLGVPSIAAWLGTRMPYHRRSLGWRWAHRRPWRRTLRWSFLVLVPYGIVPAVAVAMLLPGIAAGIALGDRNAAGHLTGWSLAVAAGLSCFLAGAAPLLGSRLTARLAARRGAALTDYLADPDRG